jgi:hypothetical protein
MSLFGRAIAAFALIFSLLGCAADNPHSDTDIPPGFVQIPGTQTSVLFTGSVGTTIYFDTNGTQDLRRTDR